ncbi:MAG: hypothetical protein AB7I04_03875 [Pseudomonadales bacterium]
MDAGAGRTLGRWCATETADFHLLSDLPEQEQAGLLETLRRIGPVAEPLLPGTPVSQPAALKIIVFSGRDDFRALTGKRKFAAFMQPSLQTNRLLVGPTGSSLTGTILHEYAHYLLRNRLDVSLPLWFDEGLASVLAEARFDDSTVTLGELPLSRLQSRVSDPPEGPQPLGMLNRTLSATAIEDWHQSRIEAFYDWSWLLVHYLYFETLEAGPIAGSPLESFLSERDTSLPDFLGETPKSLLRTLQRYVRSRPRQVERASPVVLAGDARHACLSPLDRDLELARAVLVQNPEGALDLISPWLEQRPDDVDLLVVRARIAQAADQPDEALIFSEAALALAPDHAPASILLADLTVWDCLLELGEACRDRWVQARTLYQRALRHDPSRFDGVLGLGLAYLYTGRPGEALNYIRVAYSRAPWAALANYYLGESYRLIGDTRARGYLINARNWATEPVWRLLAEESLRRIDQGGVDPSSDLQ